MFGDTQPCSTESTLWQSMEDCTIFMNHRHQCQRDADDATWLGEGAYLVSAVQTRIPGWPLSRVSKIVVGIDGSCVMPAVKLSDPRCSSGEAAA